ncbi:hypothetical protein E2542_SST12516 [Spatholobus suberectus]|nr:hypothetical protein E2542_SST12516 [Spatholobus suberectus]
MANWRKQQGDSHHQVGPWRSSSYSRKPPLDNWHSTVPAWEKKFCSSIGSVPWRKLVESKKYMHLFENVVNWDDSAGKEAFDNAKMRYWAEINGIPCNVSLPDPNMYIDNVDWNAIVDPELILDLEREVKFPSEEQRNDEVVLIGGTLYLNQQPFSCTGWGDDEAEVAKPFDPDSAVQGWRSNLHENNGVESGQQYCGPVEHENKYNAPVEHAKEYEWQDCGNDSWGWNHREHYGGDWHKMSRGRSGGYGNWGAWDGYNRRRENVSWSKTPPAYNGNEYNMNRGRRNYRGGGGGGGGRRGNFVYVPKEVPTPAAW